jgi:very-short-patch-repair endonuclease
VRRSTLVANGLTRRQFDGRIARGQLHVVYRGVYAVGHRSLSQEGRWLAAVLACGPGARLSHHSAAASWGLAADRPEVHVTMAHRLRTAGVVTHEGRLAASDRKVRHGIPVTSVARVLVDQAHAVDEDELERLLREAQFHGLFNVTALRDALTRRRSRVLTELLDDLNATQSMLEDAFLRLCRRFRIPKPRAQVRRDRRRPDFVWKHQRLIVEVDSWMAHSTPHAFQADRTLSNAVQLAGWMILRFTYTDIRRRAAMVATQVGQALDRR